MSLRKKYLTASLILIAALVLTVGSFSKSALRFSQPSGFYDSAFELEIYSDRNYTIYYTLDGSDPTEEAIRYVGPILIEDPSENDNRYASRTDVSTSFRSDVAPGRAPGPNYYPVPDYKLDKCVVVRAAAYRNGERKASLTQTYFVDFRDREEYAGLKIVSLVTDPENLFDEETGIYVTGKTFQEYIPVIGTGRDWYDNVWWWWDANYRNRGREWERPAHIEIFDIDRSSVLSSDCGLRIQGNGSRGFLPRSLSVYSRMEYSGTEYFAPNLFGGGVHRTA